MGVHHLGRDPQRDLIRVVKGLVRATLQNSSIGRAGLRWYDGGRAVFMGGGGIDIHDGGSINIDGSVSGEGDFEWDGTFTQRGPWELEGDGKITGDVEIDGKAQIKNDVTVTHDGKIIVGDMQIAQIGTAGEIKFANSASLRAAGAGISMTKNTSRVVVDNDQAMLASNGVSIHVSGAGVTINPIGLPAKHLPGVPAGLLWVNDDGVIHRTYQ